MDWTVIEPYPRSEATNAEAPRAPDVKSQFDNNGLPMEPRPAPNGVNGHGQGPPPLEPWSSLTKVALFG